MILIILQIYRNNPNCNWEVSSSYKLQLPSAALSIPSSPSPQLPKSQVQEALKLWMPWCCWSPLVLHQQPSRPHSFMLPHRVNRLSVVPHGRADRSCGSSTLKAHWLQLRAASVKIDLQQPRSEVNLYVKL